MSVRKEILRILAWTSRGIGPQPAGGFIHNPLVVVGVTARLSFEGISLGLRIYQVFP
jgi:hypothetical protein